MEEILGLKIKHLFIYKPITFPNKVFYIKNNRVLISYNKETKEVWLNYELIWSVFETEFSLDYEKMIELMINLVESHLKLEKTIPEQLSPFHSYRLEKHFKLMETIILPTS